MYEPLLVAAADDRQRHPIERGAVTRSSGNADAQRRHGRRDNAARPTAAPTPAAARTAASRSAACGRTSSRDVMGMPTSAPPAVRPEVLEGRMKSRQCFDKLSTKRCHPIAAIDPCGHIAGDSRRPQERSVGKAPAARHRPGQPASAGASVAIAAQQIVVEARSVYAFRRPPRRRAGAGSEGSRPRTRASRPRRAVWAAPPPGPHADEARGPLARSMRGEELAELVRVVGVAVVRAAARRRLIATIAASRLAVRR